MKMLADFCESAVSANVEAGPLEQKYSVSWDELDKAERRKCNALDRNGGYLITSIWL